jgi:hypothetical protein
MNKPKYKIGEVVAIFDDMESNPSNRSIRIAPVESIRVEFGVALYCLSGYCSRNIPEYKLHTYDESMLDVDWDWANGTKLFTHHRDGSKTDDTPMTLGKQTEITDLIDTLGMSDTAWVREYAARTIAVKYHE